MNAPAGRITICAAVAALATGLAGCANTLGTPPFGGISQSTEQSRAAVGSSADPAHSACVAPPNVWASSEGTPAVGAVVGYTSAGLTCVTITTANGISLLVTSGLATDIGGYLYVADTWNDRVIVFDRFGNYWSTLNVPNHHPIGVCLNHKGYVIGVVTLNTTGNTIDFFTGRGAHNSSSNPSNYAAGYLNSNRFCAFDASDDFFASGYQSPAPITLGSSLG
jgi:hypothetical protein